MEITGKIIHVLPERSGTSARGEWKAQSFVIETRDQYPRKMVFDVFGAERLQRFNIKSGDEVTVFSAEPGNRAFDVQRLDAAAAQAAGQAAAAAPQTTQAAPAPFPPAQPDAAGESTDDLPF